MDRQSCLKDTSYPRESEWYLQTGILALLGMNQWEIILSNFNLPQPTTTKPLASSALPSPIVQESNG